MDKFVFSLLIAAFTYSTAWAGSWPDRDQGRRLFLELNQAAKNGHHSLGYGEARSHLYGVVENQSPRGGGAVRAAYSGIFISPSGSEYRERGDENGDHFGNDFINCEHVWPQSQFSKQLPMRSDLHHLLPTLSVTNSKRGSWPFGPVHDVIYQTVSGSKLSASGLFEPADEVKGDVARAMLYFFTRYYDQSIFRHRGQEEFWGSKIEVLLKWHRQDPPDAWERARNDRVERVQGNRNPFIDHPEYAEQIGLELFQEIGRERHVSWRSTVSLNVLHGSF